MPPNKKTIRFVCTKENSSGIAQKLSSYKKLQQFSGGGGGKQKQNKVMERIRRTLSLFIPSPTLAQLGTKCPASPPMEEKENRVGKQLPQTLEALSKKPALVLPHADYRRD